MHRLDGHMVRVGLALGCVALTGVAFSPTATADTQAFLDQVYASGVRVPDGDPQLKEMGWEVCALFDRGVPADRVRDQAVFSSQSTPQYGMSAEQADGIVDLAVANLCSDKR